MNKARAGYPLLWVKTHEESRALRTLVRDISNTKVKNHDTGVDEKYQAYTWDVADGVHSIEIKDGCIAVGEAVPKTDNPLAALEWLEKTDGLDNTILFLKDFHTYTRKEYRDSDIVNRKIRNLVTKFEGMGKILAILSPIVEIPVELDKDVSVIEFKLPDRDALKQILKGICESASFPLDKYPKGEVEESLIDSALGMTEMEAKNAFAVCLIEAKNFDSKIIRREKSSIVKKSGILEVVETTETLADIGGLENLKSWAVTRKECSTSKAREFGILQPPKGALLVGVPGCGKSLSAKAFGTAWNRPLLRLDMGNVFGSYVGESEGNMQRCLDMCDSISPCILWVDEIEKDLAGNKAGHGQEGHETTKKVFKMLLTWLQERKSDVFLVATANSVESLPPELLRAGRIDAIFYVDLPDVVQRAEILKIHLRKAGRDPNMFDKNMTELVTLCAGYSGAEIEVWVKEAMVRAFSLDHKDLTLEDLKAAISDVTPISVLMGPDIERTRNWAKSRKTKMASIDHSRPAEAESQSGKRKINIPVPGSTDPTLN
jgi:ATP-dependent 26S proteasome regulatory subunit